MNKEWYKWKYQSMWQKKKTQDGETIIHKYKFIEKCNDDLFLYEEVKHRYKICFTKYDLGLVKEKVKPPKSDLRTEKVKI